MYAKSTAFFDDPANDAPVTGAFGRAIAWLNRVMKELTKACQLSGEYNGTEFLIHKQEVAAG